MLKAMAVHGAQPIRILRDDTDVFVLLVYWTSRIRLVTKIPREKWNGDVPNVRRAARPWKVQPASRSQCAARLRYGVVPLRKRK